MLKTEHLPHQNYRASKTVELYQVRQLSYYWSFILVSLET